MPVVTRTQLAPVGDSNKLALFQLTSTGIFDTSIIVLERLISSQMVGHPSKGNLQINMDIKQDDEAMLTFLKSYLSPVEVAVTPVKYSDSSITYLTPGLDASTPLGAIWYGGTISSKKKLYYGRCILSGDTGNADYQADNFGAYPISLQFVAGMTITIPSTKFDSSEVTGVADKALAMTEYGCVSFETGVA